MDFKLGAIIVGVVLFIGAIFGFMCIERIDPGYAGVVYNTNGGLEEDVLSQGWHFVAFWKKVTSYPVSTETVYLSKDKQEGSPNDDSFFISTKDGKLVNVDVAYSYRMNLERLPDIFTKFRGRETSEIENGFMRDRLKEACNVVSTTMDVLEVYGEKRQELNDNVFTRFKASLEEVGIVVETFSFTRVEPDAESMKAIQAKVDAKQTLERMKIEKEQAQVNADKAKIDAQGKADAKLIEAKSQAEANRILQQSLNGEIIQKQWIEKWDGKLPYVNGSGSNMLIEVPQPPQAAN